MATNGLFTKGPSIEDLLQKRNQRGADLQQQLVQQAGQGSRDPVKAQAASLIGSSLGRALAGAVGGDDKQAAAINANNAAQAAAQQDYAQNIGADTSATLQALATRLNEGGHFKAAALAKENADRLYKQEREDEKDKQKLALAAKNRLEDQTIAKDKVELEAQIRLEETLDKNLTREEEQMKKDEETRVAKQSAIAALGANPPSHLVDSIEKGSKKAIDAAWQLAANVHRDGDEARRIADIYGEGYEVGTKKNREELKKRFEKAGTTTVTVNVGEEGDKRQPLTPAMKTAMQKNLIKSRGNLVKLNGVADSFDEGHFTAWGKFKGYLGDQADKSGLVDKDTPVLGELVDFSADRQVAFTQIEQLFNSYRSEITGAAAAVQELERLYTSYINTNRGPTATRRVLDSFKDIAEKGIVELENIVEFGAALPADVEVGRNWADPEAEYTQSQLDADYEAAIAAAAAQDGTGN